MGGELGNQSEEQMWHGKQMIYRMEKKEKELFTDQNKNADI